MFNFFYDFFLLGAALFIAPKFLYQRMRYNKYRNSFAQRFGFHFPKIEKGKQKLIWVHAVSVGETKAVSPLVQKIKKEHPEYIILCSSLTETGHEEAKKSMPQADYHVFLPFDLSWIMKAALAKAKPDIVILCETDFWYNFLRLAKSAGASIFLVNGKLSDKSSRYLKKNNWFAKRLFAQIDVFCLQNAHYEKRFLSLGIPKQKIHVTGNLKFDNKEKVLNIEEVKAWKACLNISENAFVLVAGSTHHPEEKIVLEAFNQLAKHFPDLRLILVPRHPERFNEVEKILREMSLPFQRYSRSCHEPKQEAHIILIDAMGLLQKCYQIADLAIVAGSFVKHVGGHNITEPSKYGVPVIYGPYMQAQPELAALMRHHKAGLQVSQEVLSDTLSRLLNSSSEREILGLAGKKMVSEMQGSVEKTHRIIFFQDFEEKRL